MVLCFPPDFAERLEAFRGRPGSDRGRGNSRPTEPPKTRPDDSSSRPEIYLQHGQRKVADGLHPRTEACWPTGREEIGDENLAASGVPVDGRQPFDVVDARRGRRRTSGKAAVWSKILPFVLLLWALTGAFYPAVDLCAGEKERGTLETLLSSPAERSEIVWANC